MKHPFTKSVLVLSAALALVNCSSEEATSTIPTPGEQAVTPTTSKSPIVSGTTAADVIVSEPCWILTADQLYVINTKFEVFDATGAKVGTYDPTTFTISDNNGTPAMSGVNYLELTIIDPASYNNPNTNTGTTPVASSASNSGTQTQPKSSASNSNNQQATSSASNSGTQTQPKSSASNNNQPASSASNNNNQQAASSASNNNSQQGTDGTCFDKANNKNVKPYENLAGKNGESYAYKEDCTINCYYDPAGKNCASIATSTGTNNNNQQQTQQSSSSQAKSSSSVAKSSSSVAKSSSSQAQSSSSQQQQSTNTGSTGTGNFAGAKVISSSYTVKATGGKSGSGWATRYWDCCKPHCAWPGKGGKQASACDASGNKISDDGATSMCDGGNSGTCKSQIPMIVNDKLAFAFAAVPGSAGGECGKCFALEFTGTGKYETKANHKAMAGKTLVIIASNIGYDVAEGQFDIMIPGGGYGIFNGCANKMGWGDQGAQYGGLLSQCEGEVGYDGDLLTLRKQCLAKKCEASFSGDPVAKQGCMFLATWYEAAGNPNHNFKEVECPQELLSLF